MKRVVVGGDLTQRAMRPADLHAAYVERVQADIARFRLLPDAAVRGCPACGAAGVIEFTRLDFPYLRCAGCQSLFVSPVPSEARLVEYHAESDAERFRREQLVPATADVRIRHAVAPRAHWVLTAATARLGTGLAIGHVGPVSPQFTTALGSSSSAVSSVAELSDGTPAGSLDAVIAFDVLERSTDFAGGLRRCRAALRPGGLLFVTTMSGTGFEVRMLRERMHSLIPPLHLQLLSEDGWTSVLARERLALLEYSTPGELDVQAVAEACRRDPALRLPPILDELVRDEDEQVGRAFQELLQQAGLSSHVQLVAEARP